VHTYTSCSCILLILTALETEIYKPCFAEYRNKLNHCSVIIIEKQTRKRRERRKRFDKWRFSLLIFSAERMRRMLSIRSGVKEIPGSCMIPASLNTF
jgi:hypothetical protein